MADDKDLTFPRVIYRGPADVLGEGAHTHKASGELVGETGRAESYDDWVQKKKDGWRLKRDDKKNPAPEDQDTIRIPAQDITVSPQAAKEKK